MGAFRVTLLNRHLLLATLLVCPAVARADDEALSLRAAAHAQDTTPRHFPISINGNMADKLATGAHDPLHARCLVIANQQTAIGLVLVDACMMPRDLMDDAKRRTAEVTGLKPEQILISATHCHSAPTLSGVFQSEPDEPYRQFLVEQIVAGLKTCWDRLEPAQVGWGTVAVPGNIFIRRWLLKPGELALNPFGEMVDRIRMNPGFNNPQVDRPSAVPDHELSLLSVQARDGRPIAVYANYGLHYVGGVEGDQVSADYFGEFSQRIMRHLAAGSVTPPFVGILTNGTSANGNNVDYSQASSPRRQPYEQMGLVAESVAEAAARRLKTVEYHTHLPLKSVTRELSLGVRKPSPEHLQKARDLLATQPTDKPLAGLPAVYARETVLMNDYPDEVSVLLQAIRIGELGIVSSPSETFAETGLAIKEQSPLKPTFVVELANGYSGYLPTPKDHELGGYETWRARSSYLAVDAEPKIRQTLVELLGEVSARQR